jgi:hypothetical protein
VAESRLPLWRLEKEGEAGRGVLGLWTEAMQLSGYGLPRTPLLGSSVKMAYLSSMKGTRVLTGLVAVAILVFSLVALLPDCASACTCASFGGSPQQRAERMLDKSAAVFSGKVVGLKRGLSRARTAVLTR